MITCQLELAQDLWIEIRALLDVHWREIAHYQDIPLAPDEKAYNLAQDQGLLRCYTARSDGVLIGYAVFFVRYHPHYRSSLQANQDVLFVLPEHRKTRAGLQLIRYAEQALAAEGVQVVYHHVKRTNKVGELLERLGYELVDELYAKRLDRKE